MTKKQTVWMNKVKRLTKESLKNSSLDSKKKKNKSQNKKEREEKSISFTEQKH